MGGRRSNRRGAREDDGRKTERMPMSRSDCSAAQPFFRPILRRAAVAADGISGLQRTVPLPLPGQSREVPAVGFGSKNVPPVRPGAARPRGAEAHVDVRCCICLFFSCVALAAGARRGRLAPRNTHHPRWRRGRGGVPFGLAPVNQLFPVRNCDWPGGRARGVWEEEFAGWLGPGPGVPAPKFGKEQRRQGGQGAGQPRPEFDGFPPKNLAVRFRGFRAENLVKFGGFFAENWRASCRVLGEGFSGFCGRKTGRPRAKWTPQRAGSPAANFAAKKQRAGNDLQRF